MSIEMIEQPQVEEQNLEEALDEKLAAIPPHSVLVTKCGWLPQTISMGQDISALIASEMGVDQSCIKVGSYRIFDWTDTKNPHQKFLREGRGLRDALASVAGKFTTPQYSSHFKSELSNIITPQRLDSMYIISDQKIEDFKEAWDEAFLKVKNWADKFLTGVTVDGVHRDVYAEITSYHRTQSIKEQQWDYVKRRYPNAKACQQRMLQSVYSLTPVSRSLDYTGMSKEVRIQLKQRSIQQFETVCQQGLNMFIEQFNELCKRIARSCGQRKRFAKDPFNLGLFEAEIVDVEYHSDNPEIPEDKCFVTYCKSKKSEKRDGQIIRDGQPIKELWTVEKYEAHNPQQSGEYAKLSASVFRDFDEMCKRFEAIGGFLQDDGTVEELISSAKEQISVFGRNPDAQASYLKNNSNDRNAISRIAAQFQSKGLDLVQGKGRNRRHFNIGGNE